MKKLYFILCLLVISLCSNAQIINIPDVNFKNKLLAADTDNLIAQYTKIDVNNNNEIEVSEALLINKLYLYNSSIQSLEGIKSFTNLQTLNCQNNSLISLDVSDMQMLQDIYCNGNLISSISIDNLPNLMILNCSNNLLTSFNHIFLSITEINCSYNQLTSFNIVFSNNMYTGVVIDSSHNQISTLSIINTVSNLNQYLHGFNCSYNNLTSLSESDINVGLYDFNCSHNQLSSLGVISRFTGGNFNCSYNQISQITLPSFLFYDHIYLDNNNITSFVFPPAVNVGHVTELSLSNNLLEYLDLSNVGSTSPYYCENNPTLIYINLKNGASFNNSYIFNNKPNLAYVCSNEGDILNIQSYLQSYGNNTCVVNSYCSFTPGGTFYTINGNSRFDNNNNGCDSNDSIVKNNKLFITNGTVSTTIIPDASGNYSIPVQQGSHTIMPQVENPSYFSFSPPSVTINFPSQTSPFVQNFCTAFNGVHPDLEIVLVPMSSARPGFDSVFRIVYKNKGTINLSGIINLNYQDDIQDFIDSSLVPTSFGTNSVSWSFDNLTSFETREIIVTLNLNTPTENPPLDSGSLVSYQASITSNMVDETPLDNSFSLEQTVVNSFDPNDKTCLEGSSIPISQVGKYVHYLIRFENNGTADAKNVVIADKIDLAKFDIASFQTMSGSHPFVTKITENNKVEFIYENINLPFDDANNDGYVIFKIKTKPNLVINDTFSNTANIYFDYNAPISTNPANTVVGAVLSLPNFNDVSVLIAPNPVNETLSITANSVINSIMIYDINGRLVHVQICNKLQSLVDMSKVQGGIYMVKVVTSDGSAVERIVKE